MKRLFFIVLPLLLIVGCSKPVEESTLINKDGLIYLPDSDSPYSGKVFGSYPSGERLYIVSYKNGILVEDYKFFNKNGDRKSSLQTYLFLEKDGKLFNKDGPHSGWTFDSWNPDIKIQGIKFYHCSKNILWMNGEFVKSIYTVTIDGKRIVRKPILENNLIEKDGLKLDKNDIPYWGPVYGIYKSGEKHYDFNYEKGVVVGNYTFYNKDGSLKEPINYEETLNERDGVFYTKDTNKPYSGQVFSLFDDGKKKEEGILKDGKMISKTEWEYYRGYFGNGQKRTKRTFKNGIENGLRTDWYVNGQKREEGTLKDGKMISKTEWEWYESGQKELEGTSKDGKLDGLWTRWYENGQKWFESIYKDGEEDGLWTWWYENGQKSSERIYKDGKEGGIRTTWYENGQKKSEDTYKDGKRISIKEWNEDGSVKE